DGFRLSLRDVDITNRSQATAWSRLYRFPEPRFAIPHNSVALTEQGPRAPLHWRQCRDRNASELAQCLRARLPKDPMNLENPDPLQRELLPSATECPSPARSGPM